ncbi:hypothetical protein [Actinoplanes subglobosus]|uniref:Uncharacterized protein n=1 Tax=Actinoplanes subglobosus TaxID=1547892 RepID=A0ABV8IP61_9ACTN
MAGFGGLAALPRRRAAQSRERAALRESNAGRHDRAVLLAEAGVARCRPIGERWPASLGRVLAIHAYCLHRAGRDDEQAANESYGWCRKATSAKATAEVTRAAFFLAAAGYREAGYRLVEQALTAARPVGGVELGRAYTELARHLLMHNSPEDALLALREAESVLPEWRTARMDTVLLLFRALGDTGRYDELREHCDRWLALVRLNSRFQLRREYPLLLGALRVYWTAAGDDERLEQVRALTAKADLSG